MLEVENSNNRKNIHWRKDRRTGGNDE